MTVRILTGTEEAASITGKLRPRSRRWILALGSLVVAVAVAEASLRFLLFSERCAGWGLARRLRSASAYASNAGRDYWKLDVLFGPPRARRTHPLFEERFGWLAEEIDPLTLSHRDEPTVGDRRPVLLFGDSYAQCVQRAGNCWQQLLEESPLADRHRLLNYGVGGYGVDQAILLMEAALPRWVDRNPIVVLAILVDDDLDRAWLPLRHFPKPWFELEGRTLRRHGIAEGNPAAFVQASPPDIPSYLLRLLLFDSGLFAPATATRWTEGAGLVARKQALNAALIEAVQDLWERAGLEGFFLLFHGKGCLSRGPSGQAVEWQEAFLREELTARGLRFVSSRPLLEEALAGGAALSDLYYFDPPGLNHYTTRANELVFAALVAGLEGRGEAGTGR